MRELDYCDAHAEAALYCARCMIEAFAAGAAVAFGLMGMAEEIGQNENVRVYDSNIPPCRFCGRLLYLGGPCCPRAAQAQMSLLAKERDHARKCLGREMSRANAQQKKADDAIRHAQNEAAAVRRAYLHERHRAQAAITLLHVYAPAQADLLTSQAYGETDLELLATALLSAYPDTKDRP